MASFEDGPGLHDVSRAKGGVFSQEMLENKPREVEARSIYGDLMRKIGIDIHNQESRETVFQTIRTIGEEHSGWIAIVQDSGDIAVISSDQLIGTIMVGAPTGSETLDRYLQYLSKE